VLIDSRHRKWFLATLAVAAAALGFYLWRYQATPGGLTGGTTVGLWYGIIGSGLMVYAAMLSLLRRVPSWWWVGSRKVWLRGHVWLGLLSGLFILCHSGFRWGGPLAVALWVLLLATLTTGVLGLVLQQFLPRMITTRVPREAPYEQIPHLCAVLRQRAEAAVEQVAGDDKLHAEAKPHLRSFYEEEIRPFLAPRYLSSSPLAHPLRAEAIFGRERSAPGLADLKGPLTALEGFCEERRQLGEQERLHRLLHGWLLAHVPLSVALLILGLAHAIMSLYY
jgi:hypothetical protein